MSLYRAISCFLLLLMLVSSAEAKAAGTFTIQEENDSFAINDRADRAYTNGTRLTWTWSPAARSRVDRLLEQLCGRAGHNSCGGDATIAIGQNMYTPEDLRSRRKIIGDRPYGGWLYGMFALDARRQENTDHVELYAGVVGPAAHAAETQKFVHGKIGATEPLGWDTQIGNHPGVLLAYEHRLKFVELFDSKGRPFFDATPTLGGAIGTVFDYASAGATIRAGCNLPPKFFRPIPSIASMELTSAAGTPPPSQWDAYVFATAEARYVAHNIFIDTDHEVYAIQREPIVRDRRIGVSARVRWLRFQYAQTFRSPEFKPAPRPHSFATFTVTVGTSP